MTNIENKTSKVDEVRATIRTVASRATPDDRKRVADLLATAVEGKHLAMFTSLTPPMCAILFLDHNPHNRDWRVEGAKSCLEYARRMQSMIWQVNNATIGFYDDGLIADGQHRLSAAAFAGHTLETGVIFGISKDAIVTVDDLAVRHGSDHAKLHGVADAVVKQTIIKQARSYAIKAGTVDKSQALKSEAEVHDAIRAENHMLDQAIAIGEDSIKNVSAPTLKKTQSQILAYLLLTSGWPADRLRDRLKLFQLASSDDSDKNPLYVGLDFVRHAREKVHTKLSGAKELGVAVVAMTASERGVKALSAAHIKNAVKRGPLPDPTYPVIEPQATAA